MSDRVSYSRVSVIRVQWCMRCGYGGCMSKELLLRYYLKMADTFPNKDDVTSINFLSFIGIGSP